MLGVNNVAFPVLELKEMETLPLICSMPALQMTRK